jgi:hypothetical protein
VRKGLKFLLCLLVGILFIPTVKAEGITVNDIVNKFNELVEDGRNKTTGEGMTAEVCSDEQDSAGKCTEGNIYITIVTADEYDEDFKVVSTKESYLELELKDNVLSCTITDSSTQYFAFYNSILAVFEIQGKEYVANDLTVTIDKIAFDENSSFEKDGMEFIFNEDDSVDFRLDVAKNIKLIEAVSLTINQRNGIGSFKYALVDDEYDESTTNIVSLYAKGDKVKLKAVEDDEDYKFANWLIVTKGKTDEDDKYEVYSFDKEITLELSNDINLVANFVLKEIEKEDFEVTKGNNLSYEKGKDLAITASGDIFDLLGIKVDGIFISNKHFNISNGSTILTLNSEYLDTLSEGNHIVTFVYANGEADATISIPETIKNPKTLDNISMYIVLLFLSAVSLGLIRKYCC